MLLRSVERKPNAKTGEGFPDSLPFLKNFTELHFQSPITFLAGENGSGKSTFLEALACAIGSITVGSESVNTDPTLAPIRDFALRNFKLTWSKRTQKGFFMRSEDFFGYAKKMAQLRSELESDLKAVDQDYKGRSLLAKNLAKMPYRNEIHTMQQAYGDSLDSQSHGEGFFKLFNERFTGEGVYLLDEPEAPLSPTRQLSLISMLHLMVKQGGQFIIATHSPILMAYPDAAIWSFDGGALQSIPYEALEHVTVTKSFLNNPESYLRHLLAD